MMNRGWRSAGERKGVRSAVTAGGSRLCAGMLLVSPTKRAAGQLCVGSSQNAGSMLMLRDRVLLMRSNSWCGLDRAKTPHFLGFTLCMCMCWLCFQGNVARDSIGALVPGLTYCYCVPGARRS